MPSPSLRRARAGTSVVFFLAGFLVASWLSRIPVVQGRLALSEGSLGLSLLGAAVGSLLLMPPTGAWVARYGSRPVTTAATIAFALTLPGPSLAWSAWSLFGFLCVMGAACGSMDVAMNAQAVAVENRYQRPIMSSFHGVFSLGGMTGSALGGLLARFAVPLEWHLVAIAGLGLLATAWAVPRMLPAATDAAPPATKREPLNRIIVALGVLAFCILVGEGAMADWTSVYLNSFLGTSEAVAATGYAVFSALMATGRFLGDRLTERYGGVALVRGGTLLAAVGLGLGLLAGTTAGAFFGFACTGAGFSIIIPLVFGAAGRAHEHSAGTGLAAVTTAGYLGFLSGPPLIGFVAEAATLRVGLGVVVLLSVVGALLAGAVSVGRERPSRITLPGVPAENKT